MTDFISGKNTFNTTGCACVQAACIFLQLYEKAIKDLKAGLPVDYDGLPVPPGKLMSVNHIDTSSKWLCVHAASKLYQCHSPYVCLTTNNIMSS